MKKKLFISLIAVTLLVIYIVIVLASKHALLVHPKGIISSSILGLIVTNILLMLTIILPTYVLLFTVVWKYCIQKKETEHNPDQTATPFAELLMWGLPTLVVAVMAFITWFATHELNPYKPIESDKKPLLIQVVAMDWKWLFIYPEQGIAALNTLHIPEKTPIHFRLTADRAPMNSFWIPQLSGQIYSMTGMSTQLFLMADGPGKYVGRAVEINGEGYSSMTFGVESSSEKDFEEWVEKVKGSSHHLTEEAYAELVQPGINREIVLFSNVKENLYQKIIHSYMHPL